MWRITTRMRDSRVTLAGPYNIKRLRVMRVGANSGSVVKQRN